MNDTARGTEPPLRGALEAFLSGWQDDVAPAWQGVLDGVRLPFDAVPADLTLGPADRIFPLRKGHGVADAPAGSHVLRALDGVAPADVRVVLVGQDPYPKFVRATGRSFEPGDFTGWHDRQAQSFQRIAQALVQHRQPDPRYVPEDTGWAVALGHLDAGRVTLDAPKALFDGWERQGVLFLNLGLTLSRFHKPTQLAHMALWQPVVRAILLHLALRPQGALVVVPWGGEAQDAVKAMGVVQAAQQAGRANHLAVVRRAHPAYDGEAGGDDTVPFLQLPDPFSQVNAALVSVGGKPIQW